MTKLQMKQVKRCLSSKALKRDRFSDLLHLCQMCLCSHRMTTAGLFQCNRNQWQNSWWFQGLKYSPYKEKLLGVCTPEDSSYNSSLSNLIAWMGNKHQNVISGESHFILLLTRNMLYPLNFFPGSCGDSMRFQIINYLHFGTGQGFELSG